jgi:predicted nucleic acid-binding Zn ribbon protein
LKIHNPDCSESCPPKKRKRKKNNMPFQIWSINSISNGSLESGGITQEFAVQSYLNNLKHAKFASKNRLLNVCSTKGLIFNKKKRRFAADKRSSMFSVAKERKLYVQITLI